MSILKTLRSMILGILLHFLLMPFGAIATMVVFSKPTNEIYYISGACYLPFLAAGAILGLTRGINRPMLIAGLSALFVLVAVVIWGLIESGPPETLEPYYFYVRCTPGIALSCLGAFFGYQKRIDPNPKSESLPAND